MSHNIWMLQSSTIPLQCVSIHTICIAWILIDHLERWLAAIGRVLIPHDASPVLYLERRQFYQSMYDNKSVISLLNRFWCHLYNYLLLIVEKNWSISIHMSLIELIWISQQSFNEKALRAYFVFIPTTNGVFRCSVRWLVCWWNVVSQTSSTVFMWPEGNLL